MHINHFVAERAMKRFVKDGHAQPSLDHSSIMRRRDVLLQSLGGHTMESLSCTTAACVVGVGLVSPVVLAGSPELREGVRIDGLGELLLGRLVLAVCFYAGLWWHSLVAICAGSGGVGEGACAVPYVVCVNLAAQGFACRVGGKESGWAVLGRAAQTQDPHTGGQRSK